MLLFDSLLRLPTVVGLLFFAVLLLRDEERSLKTLIAAALAISLSALFLSNAPAALALPYQPWIAAKVLAVPNLALLWWFGWSLLDDDFKLGLPEWAGFALLCATNFPLLPEKIGFDTGWGIFMFDALGFAVPVHLAFLAFTGWRDDLIQQRRYFRIALLVWLVVALSIILLMERYSIPEPTLSLVRMGLTFPAVWMIIFVSTQMRPSVSLMSPSRPIKKPPAPNSVRSAALERLLHAIESDKVYLDATLTITALSKTCGVTEYQMRKLINEHLGFANFSEFLNTYRIDEATHQLIHSEQSITSIALSCGFQTLSTFNRAFQKIQGQTPTYYRQAASRSDI
jgi:AraC-like DNA-binding protein